MFDGKSKALVENGVVLVDGDKIDAGSDLPIPSAAHVIDLGDATLCPGFMDAHRHLTLDLSGDYNQRRLKEVDLNVSEQAIIATAYARATVEAALCRYHGNRACLIRDEGRQNHSAEPCRRPKTENTASPDLAAPADCYTLQSVHVRL